MNGQLKCAGRARRRRCFGSDTANPESGVALRLPPHSKTLCASTWDGSTGLRLPVRARWARTPVGQNCGMTSAGLKVIGLSSQLTTQNQELIIAPPPPPPYRPESIEHCVGTTTSCYPSNN